MNEPGHEVRSIDEILAAARARLDRVQPIDLERERLAGALIVDIRPFEQRTRDGELPGAVVIDRNVLEWRMDPSCEHRLADVSYDLRIIIVCNEGYGSSLAAAELRDLGLHRATDLDGGYQAWLAAGCAQIVRDAPTSHAPVPSTTPRPGT